MSDNSLYISSLCLKLSDSSLSETSPLHVISSSVSGSLRSGMLGEEKHTVAAARILARSIKKPAMKEDMFVCIEPMRFKSKATIIQPC